MKKYLFVLILTFAFNHICNAQLISQKFISEITYSNNGGFTQKYYISDKNSPMMLVQNYPVEKDYEPSYELIIPQIDLNATLNGKLYLGKYFEIMGWSKSDSEMNSGGKKYELSQANIPYQNFPNCRLISIQTDDNETVEMYFTKAGSDKIDYSPSANYALRKQGMPEILNFDKILGKGWVLVYGYVLINDSTIPFTYETLESVKDNISEIIISEQDIPEDYKPRAELAEDDNYPAFCEVYSLDTKTDTKTGDLVYNFTLQTCKMYNLFGRYNHEDYSRYYDEELEDSIRYYRKEKILSEKQIEIFRKAAMELKLQLPK